jgi:hypothetical protein
MKDKSDICQIIIILWSIYSLLVLFITLLNTNINPYIITLIHVLGMIGVGFILFLKNDKKGLIIKSISIIFIIAQGLLVFF